MTNNWPTTTVGTLFDIGAGKSVTPAARHGSRNHPFLRTANILWGRVDLTEVDSMHFSDDEIATKSLQKGDLLVCEGGDIGRSAIWNGELPSCSFQNHLHRLRPKSADVLPRFFMYYLQAGFTQLGIYEGAGNKTTIPNLSRNRLAALEVPKLPRLEQEKIAAVLWKVQRGIEAQETLLMIARELKRSAMRQLFTRGLRGEPQKETEIGPIPQSWNIRPLRELREFLQYGTSAKCDYESKGRPVLRIPNVAAGSISTKDLKWCELTDREVASIELETGDVLFVRTNAVRERVGRTAVYHGDPPAALFASYLIRARLKLQELVPEFLQYFSMSHSGVAQLSGRSSPAADGKFNINMNRIDSVLVPLPLPDEQNDIIAILDMINRKISLHERKRSALQELFKTLLNRLMTGELRVDDLDIDVAEVAAA